MADFDRWNNPIYRKKRLRFTTPQFNSYQPEEVPIYPVEVPDNDLELYYPKPKRTTDDGNGNQSEVNAEMIVLCSPEAVKKGSNVPLVFTVILTDENTVPINVIEEDLLVDFVIKGSAKYSVDYELAGSNTSTVSFEGNGSTGTRGTVVIPIGESHADIQFISIADEDSEGDETIIVALTPNPTYVINKAFSSAKGIISEDSLIIKLEAISPVTSADYPNDVVINEGNESPLVYRFTPLQNISSTYTNSAIIVRFLLGGVAQIEVDYNLPVYDDPLSGVYPTLVTNYPIEYVIEKLNEPAVTYHGTFTHKGTIQIPSGYLTQDGKTEAQLAINLNLYALADEEAEEAESISIAMMMSRQYYRQPLDAVVSYIVAIVANYKFKVLVFSGQLTVEGFDNDIAISNSSGYSQIGLVNTGDGYIAIGKSGNHYLFDINGVQSIQNLVASQFIDDLVPDFYWYGGSLLLAEQSKDNVESTHVFNPLSTNQNQYWATYFDTRLRNRQIPNYVPQTGISKTTTESWVVTDSNNVATNCYSNFSYTYNHYVLNEPISYTANLDYSEQTGYSICHYELNKDALLDETIDVIQNNTSTALKSDIYNPPDGKAFHVVRTISSIVDESSIENHLPFTPNYCSHAITKDYVKIFQYSEVQVKNIYKRFGYYWALRGVTLIPDSLGAAGITNQYDPDTGTLTRYAGSPVTYYEGSAVDTSDIVYSVITSNAGMADYKYYWAAWSHTKYGSPIIWDFYNIEGHVVPFGYGGYPLLSLTENLTGVTIDLYQYRGTGNIYQGYNVGDPIYYTYNKHNSVSETYSLLSSAIEKNDYTDVTSIFLDSSISIYYYQTNKYNKTQIQEWEYYKTYTHADLNNIDSGGTFTTTTTTPFNIDYDQNEDNPTTSILVIKMDSLATDGITPVNTVYEIKDFTEASGFDFGNRCFFVASTNLTELTNGTYELNNYQVGIHWNNYGNYTKVLKRFQSNSVSNPTGIVTYHPITPFTGEGLAVEIYHIVSSVTTKYRGTIVGLDGTPSNDIDYRKEEWTNWDSITLTITPDSMVSIDFFCWDNIYNNAIIIVPEDNHTVSLLNYLDYSSSKKNTNIYLDNSGNLQIAISKTPIVSTETTTQLVDLYGFPNNFLVLESDSIHPLEYCSNGSWKDYADGKQVTIPTSGKIWVRTLNAGNPDIVSLTVTHPTGLTYTAESTRDVTGTLYTVDYVGDDSIADPDSDPAVQAYTPNLFVAEDSVYVMFEVISVATIDLSIAQTIDLQDGGFQRIGNDSSSLSPLTNGSNFISYHP